MNKELFLSQLERLLYEIPKEEREEAMDYYRSYFDDAGAENEAVVLEELESPKIIADSIKEALNSTGDMTGALKNPPQVRESQAQSEKCGYEKGRSGQRYKSIFSDSDFHKQSERTESADANTGESEWSKSSAGTGYRRYDQYAGRSDKRSKLIIFIILAVFTSPVWGTALSGILGVLGVLFASVVLLGICSVGGVIGGIVCTIIAIVKLCSLSLVQGLFMLGIGMLLLAGGGISLVLVLLVCGRLLPWLCRQVMRLFQRVLHWGRSTA